MKKLLFAAVVLLAAAAAMADADFVEVCRQSAEKADFTFMWASDTHHQAKGSYGAQEALIDEFTSAANDIGTDMLAITGDLVNGYYNRECQASDLSELRSWLDKAKAPVMLTMGNHDDNAWFISGQASVKEIGSLDELFPKEDFYKIALKGHEKEFVTDKDNPWGGWFYKDFSKAKIRVIMLNSVDIPYIPTEKGLKYYGQWTYGYSEAQLNWLANKALRFSKPGWGVIVMTHVDFASRKFFDGIMLPKNSEIVQGLLEAYAKKDMGTLYSEEKDFEAKVKYNFRRNASDEVIAVFAGHQHSNQYDYVKEVPHILISNIFNKTNGGFDYVAINRKKRTINTRRYMNGAAAPQFNRAFVY